jgi:hypothetical protein
MVAFMLERGADVNKSGAPWATSLAWARKKGHAVIEADLRQVGARWPSRRPYYDHPILPALEIQLRRINANIHDNP